MEFASKTDSGCINYLKSTVKNTKIKDKNWSYPTKIYKTLNSLVLNATKLLALPALFSK